MRGSFALLLLLLAKLPLQALGQADLSNSEASKDADLLYRLRDSFVNGKELLADWQAGTLPCGTNGSMPWGGIACAEGRVVAM